MLDRHYDRAAQDIGNIINIGHVNVCIDDQHVATRYYVTGLGLTRDPFLNTGAGNMWINVGMSQFHLPMGKPEILRGVTGLVIPDREALLDRLRKRAKRWPAPNSISAKATTASRRFAPGATASTSTRRTKSSSAAFNSACPMSVSTSAPAPSSVSRISIVR